MKQVLAVLVLGLLVGCAALTQKLGLEQADTTPQRLAYAYTLLAEVRDNTAHLVTVKRLDVTVARHVQVYADIARTALDQAKGLYFSNEPAQAVKYLQSAESMLAQIQQLVAEQQRRP